MTFDEVHTLLPVLAALVERAKDAAIKAGLYDGQMQELSQKIFLSGGMHVDVPAAARRRANRDKAMQEVKTTIEEIEEVGAKVANLGEGMLEIACQVDGRTVLLCWTEGETEILRWREDVEGAETRAVADGPFRKDRERWN